MKESEREREEGGDRKNERLKEKEREGGGGREKDKHRMTRG